MKKKLCIFLIIMIAFFANKAVVNAADPSSSLKTMCDTICYTYDTMYYTGDYMDNCYNDCISHTEYDNACYMVGGTVSLTNDTKKCYGNYICKNNANSNWCKTHDNGQKANSDTEVEMDIQARQNQKYDQCHAAYISVFSEGSVELENAIDACMNDLSGYCNTEASCRSILCNKDEFRDSKYCLSGQTARDYISSSSSGGTKGSLAEDLIDPNAYNVSNCYGFGEIVYYTTLIIKIIQITAPIILIIWASIDLFRSLIAGDEKKIVELRKPILQRFIAAAAIFLVPWIVSTIVSNLTSDNGWLTCWKNYRYKASYNTNTDSKIVINEQYTVELD